jgi:hypothetical protein
VIFLEISTRIIPLESFKKQPQINNEKKFKKKEEEAVVRLKRRKARLVLLPKKLKV